MADGIKIAAKKVGNQATSSSNMPNVQGGNANIQGGASVPVSAPTLQPTTNMNPNDYRIADSGTDLGATTSLPSAGGGSAVSGLLSRLTGRRGDVEQAYQDLFASLETLLKARSGELDTQYGEQLSKASSDFADVLPQIDASYAALGSYDSTQRGDNRAKAEKGYEDTVKTIGSNKSKDVSALGQYGEESKARFAADRDAALRYIDSAAETTDPDALRLASNNLDTNLGQARVTKATLGTDASAAEAIKGLTSDNGRFQAAIESLDSVIKSSLPNDVKTAAVKAVTDASGLSEDEKKRVQAQYGNTYAEQATL